MDEFSDVGKYGVFSWFEFRSERVFGLSSKLIIFLTFYWMTIAQKE